MEFFNDTSSLSSKVYDYTNVFALPTICLIGIITNLLSIVIISKIMRNETIYFYMLINSISELLFLAISFFTFLFRCGLLCSVGYTYESKWYELYIYSLFVCSLITFIALLNISVSVDQYNSSLLRFANSEKRVAFVVRCVLLFTAALILMAPKFLFSQQIVEIGKLAHYHFDDVEKFVRYEPIYQRTLRTEWQTSITL